MRERNRFKKETSSSSEAGIARLRELRKRMEIEKLEVIRYLENKKEENKEGKKERRNWNCSFQMDGWNGGG